MEMKRVGATKTTSTFSPATPNGESKAIGSMVAADSPSSALKPQFRYPFPLSMYSDPPLCEVTVEEFEELAFARLESTQLLSC